MTRKIIPYLTKDWESNLRYLCIGACSITTGKYTTIGKKVTCKNCKRKLKKRKARK